MDFYSLLLFAHITFAIVWLGSGILLHVLLSRFNSADDAVALEKIFGSTEALGNRLFMPSSLLVLLSGIVLTIDGPWSFGSLWIVLALIGFALTFLIGALWIGPQSGRVKEAMERGGGMTEEARRLATRMMVVGRIDSVVLFLIVFDMAIKPTGDDVGALIVMAAVLVLAILVFGGRARALEPETS